MGIFIADSWEVNLQLLLFTVFKQFQKIKITIHLLISRKLTRNKYHNIKIKKPREGIDSVELHFAR
ncbi:MAG: hypothetical protein CUR32_07815 [Flavobacterium sp.]|nr:MAG: hypothetical protein CUR32_07815 [Flavobacterium sp.] [Flavobacterium sp. FEMGT703F]